VDGITITGGMIAVIITNIGIAIITIITIDMTMTDIGTTGGRVILYSCVHQQRYKKAWAFEKVLAK
jgi:hypothetical protein